MHERKIKPIQYRFNIYIENENVVIDLLNKLGLKNRCNTRRHMSNILANALTAIAMDQTAQFYLATDDHCVLTDRYNPLKLQRRGLVRVVKQMVYSGYLDMKSGFSLPSGTKCVTMFTITSKLMPIINELDQCVRMKRFDIPVVVSDNKVWIDYKTEEVNMDEANVLMMYNEFLDKHEILCDDDNFICQCYNGDGLTMVRKFSNKDQNLGGRFYGPWQSIQKNINPVRDSLTIDGEPTIELDFRAIHPTILWSQIGKSVFSEVGYPYDIGTVVHVDPVCNSKAIKVLFSCMLSTTQKRNAIEAAMNALEMTLDPAVMGEACDELLKKHQPISQNFFKGKVKSLELQYQDSLVCLDIFGSLMDMGILSLPIHDSFIVQEKHEEQLRLVMIEKFEKRFGVTPEIKRG